MNSECRKWDDNHFFYSISKLAVTNIPSKGAEHWMMLEDAFREWFDYY